MTLFLTFNLQCEQFVQKKGDLWINNKSNSL